MPYDALPHQPTADSIASHIEAMRADHLAAGVASAAVRRDRLRRAIELLKTHCDEICVAAEQDFGGRHVATTLMMDVNASITALKHAHRHCAAWMKPRRRAGLFPFNLFGARAQVRLQPKGVVGIAGTWNGPVFMLFAPLAGVLAAGNRAMLKPSDLSPAVSALLARVVPKFFSPLEIAVVTGDVAVAQAFTRQHFDHLVFTGSAQVARQIMRDAADHLMPLTLELGGKSPTIISRSADLAHAADRIAMGRSQNGGQICVMPDTVYVPREQLDAFVAEFRKVWLEMFPSTTGNASLTAVANPRHLQRIEQKVSEAAEAGARIESLGEAAADAADRRRPLRLVVDAPAHTAIAREEIFGPAMLIQLYDEIAEVVAAINAGGEPLALYWFGSDAAEREFVLDHTRSGGVAINDVLIQVGLNDAPFGGFGASGMGHYNGREGFEQFSHLRTVYSAGWWDPRRALGMLPPYTEKFVKMMRDQVRKA